MVRRRGQLTVRFRLVEAAAILRGQKKAEGTVSALVNVLRTWSTGAVSVPHLVAGRRGLSESVVLRRAGTRSRRFLFGVDRDGWYTRVGPGRSRHDPLRKRFGRRGRIWEQMRLRRLLGSDPLESRRGEGGWIEVRGRVGAEGVLDSIGLGSGEVRGRRALLTDA